MASFHNCGLDVPYKAAYAAISLSRASKHRARIPASTPHCPLPLTRGRYHLSEGSHADRERARSDGNHGRILDAGASRACIQRNDFRFRRLLRDICATETRSPRSVHRSRFLRATGQFLAHCLSQIRNAPSSPFFANWRARYPWTSREQTLAIVVEPPGKTRELDVRPMQAAIVLSSAGRCSRSNL